MNYTTPKTPTPDTRPSGSAALRARVFTLLEEGELSSVVGRIVEVLLIGLIVANVAAVALETIPSVYATWKNVFLAFEKISVGAYTIEYVLRVWCSVEDPRIGTRGPTKGRIAFALRPLMVVDFLAFAPSYLSLILPIDLRLLRIFRLFRLVKLARYSQALPALLGVLYAERSALFASTIMLISTVCVAGEVMHIVEGTVQPKALGTLPDSMYWAITTLTTVGYGDIVPTTPLGKLVAGLTMVTGLALFALPIGIIANGFVKGLDRRRFAITWSMLKLQPLFAGVDVETLDDVLDCANADIVREHGQLCVAEENATSMFLIVSGTARDDHDEEKHVLSAGQIIGAEALRQQAKYRQTVTARSEMRIIALPAEDLRRLARKNQLLRQRIEAAIPQDSDDRIDSKARLEQLEAENSKLRSLVADLMLGKKVPGSSGGDSAV